MLVRDDAPAAFATVTSTVPAAFDGETAANDVAEATTTLVAGVEPNDTVTPGTKPVPTIVT